jgi:hypothetical protein
MGVLLVDRMYPSGHRTPTDYSKHWSRQAPNTIMTHCVGSRLN